MNRMDVVERGTAYESRAEWVRDALLSVDTVAQLLLFLVVAVAFAPILEASVSGITVGAVDSLDSTAGRWLAVVGAVSYATGMRLFKTRFDL